jgi:hypothetical protein
MTINKKAETILKAALAEAQRTAGIYYPLHHQHAKAEQDYRIALEYVATVLLPMMLQQKEPKP